MHDARDAEDKRLLEAKEHTQLLENYVYFVQEWVAVRMRDRQAADEVVQRVFLRLASELAAGKFYRVPYRVVVWSVVSWTARGYEWTAKKGAALPDEWDAPAPDEYEAWEAEHDLGPLLEPAAELDDWRRRLDRSDPLSRRWEGRLRRDLEVEAVAASVGMEQVPVTVDEVRRILVGERPASVTGVTPIVRAM